MEKKELKFEDFLKGLSPDFEENVSQVHKILIDGGCAVKLQEAKNGYVVSYTDGKTKKTIANLVSRKKGPMIRIYGDHVNQYTSVLDTLPKKMIQAIEKASSCKRLIDPAKCNSRCAMGYEFDLAGTHHQKCRYTGFMFLMEQENLASIKAFLTNEIALRTA